MKLPAIKPKKVIAKLRKVGFCIDHQTGSHIILLHRDGRRVTVPRHNKDLKEGTLKGILKQVRLGVKEFIELK